MVFSMIAIAGLSFIVWVHHFFTMGAGAGVNSFFSITTMAISVPTGVKIFNWLLTLYKGRIKMTVAMMWSLAFIPNFVIGGITGVMLAMASADYQYHNTYFLVAHFHYVLVAGTVFACFAGLYYWYPKAFGHMLNERLGKISFWLFMIGFNVCFFPLYFVGLMGMARRMYTYSPGLGWTGINIVATIGAFGMGLGFIVLVYSIYYSARYGKRDVTGDPWDGRTFEWMIPSPPPHYNFAKIPQVSRLDEYWYLKKEKGFKEAREVKEEELKPIHMPNKSHVPAIMSVFFFIAGFGLVWEWYWMAIPGLIGVLACMVIRSFDYNEGFYLSVEEVKEAHKVGEGN
jgi:cytochrome aa3-600 menaquinol oxidase subunit 1